VLYDVTVWQDLREQIDTLQEKVQKLKRAVKVYAKRLKANEGMNDDSVFEIILYLWLPD